MTVYNIAAGSGVTTIANFHGAANIYSQADAALVDTLRFSGAGLVAENMQLRQSGADVLITFVGVSGTTVRLTNLTMSMLGNDLSNDWVGHRFGNFIFNDQSAVSTEVDVQDPAAPFYDVQHNLAVTYVDPAASYMSGSIFNDTIMGSSGNDNLYGHDGNDIIRGFNGND